MIAPKQVTVTIDGQQCTGTAGQTILEIARAHGIYIPTLCYLKGLTSWGGCRVCIVEIKGSPKVVPSCATPAMDGAEIITNSDRLVQLRKCTLELLFSERNHICPICPYNKGDCGLQHQGMTHGITGIRYRYLYPALPVDVTAKYFGIDQNRCILCTRCVRTCDEVEGVHALDVANRGSRNEIVVDMNVGFGKSETCTSCGACVANCPTGAFFDKAAAFRGPLASCQTVMTTCAECPVGCGLKVFTKENRIVNVWGDPDSPVSAGHLCAKGRYETWAEPRERLTTPLIKGQPATWEVAAKFIQDTVAKAPGWQTGLLVSPRLTNEAVQAVRGLADKFDRVAAFVAPHESSLCGQPEYAPDALSRIDDADAVILLGVQPSRDHGVLAARIRRAVRQRGAKLLIFHARKSNLDSLADIAANVVSLERSVWKHVTDTLAGVKRPVLVYGPEAMSPIGVTVLERLIKAFDARTDGTGPTVVPMPRTTNSLGCGAAGIELLDEVAPWLDSKPLSYLHIVASDEPDGGARLLEERHVSTLLSDVDCIVVQAAYRSALTDLAQVVLPAATWAERSGTLTNFEGRALPVRPVVSPAGAAREDKTILEKLFA
jgi:formate dehydrogenase major subunit